MVTLFLDFILKHPSLVVSLIFKFLCAQESDFIVPIEKFMVFCYYFVNVTMLQCQVLITVKAKKKKMLA